jgi:hypothetical protein
MKKLIPFVMYSTAAALCLAAVSASAGFVTPRVPPAANPVAARVMADQAFTPNILPTVRTVTTTRDDGPGSLRHAIASSAPGDVINFALRLPATIVLASTLDIDQSLTVLGPGANKLTVMRSEAKHTPNFRVFDVEAGVVTIAGITIRNGSAFSGTNIHDNVGGAILKRAHHRLGHKRHSQRLAGFWRRHLHRHRQPACGLQLHLQRQSGERRGRRDMHAGADRLPGRRLHDQRQLRRAAGRRVELPGARRHAAELHDCRQRDGGGWRRQRHRECGF